MRTFRGHDDLQLHGRQNSHKGIRRERHRSAGQLTFSDASLTMDLVWSQDALPAKEFLAEHQLPQVVKICNAQVSSDDNLDTQQPILLYSARKGSKVLANSIHWIDEDKTWSSTGPALAIPVNFPGWFQIIGNENDDDRDTFFNTIAKIAAAMPKRFLIRSSVMGFQPIKGHDICVARQISAGEVLTVKRIHTEDGNSRRGHSNSLFNCQLKCFRRLFKRNGGYQGGTLERNKQYLVCMDSFGKDVIFPFDHKGLFSPVAEAGLGVSSSVYQLSHCIRHLELPIILKLVYGDPPTTPCNFTGYLKLNKVYGDETIIASTLSAMERNVLIEISVDAHVHFMRAINTEEYQRHNLYKESLRQCDENVDSYGSSIKPWVKVSTSNSELNTVTKSSSTTDVPSNYKPKEEKKQIYRSIKMSLPPIPKDSMDDQNNYSDKALAKSTSGRELVHAKLVFLNDLTDTKDSDKPQIGIENKRQSHLSEDESQDPNYDTIPSRNGTIKEDHHGYLIPSDARKASSMKHVTSFNIYDDTTNVRGSRQIPNIPRNCTYGEVVTHSDFNKVEEWVGSQRFSASADSGSTWTDQSNMSQQIDDLFQFSSDQSFEKDDADTLKDSKTTLVHHGTDCGSCASIPSFPAPAPPHGTCANCDDIRLKDLLQKRSRDDPQFMIGSVKMKTRGRSDSSSQRRLNRLNATVRSHNQYRMRRSLGNIPWVTTEETGIKDADRDIIEYEHTPSKRIGRTRHGSFLVSEQYCHPDYDDIVYNQNLTHSQNQRPIVYHEVMSGNAIDDYGSRSPQEIHSHIYEDRGVVRRSRSHVRDRSEDRIRRHSYDASQFNRSFSVANTDSGLSLGRASPAYNEMNKDSLLSPNNADSDFSSFDCEDWIPPDDISTLSVSDVKRSLRYIGMRATIVQRFYIEQIDGKMLHEISDRLLQEGFPEMNALERKKVVNFVNGWRPKKD